MTVGKAELTNRFAYHPATADSAPKHSAVRDLHLALASELDELIPDGRDKSLALTALQESMHWANSAIAMLGPVASDPQLVHAFLASGGSYSGHQVDGGIG